MFQVDTYAPYLWRTISRESHVGRSQARENLQADVAIVGGGLTALATALSLSQFGVSTVILEGKEIGSGASGRNMGFVIPHHTGISPDQVDRQLGPECGSRYNTMVANSAAKLSKFIEEEGIACDPVFNGWFNPAHSSASLKKIESTFRQWERRGVDVRWMDRNQTESMLGSRSYHGAWFNKTGGQVNPYALCQGLATAVESRGVKIYEHSAALSVQRKGTRWSVAVNGGSVTADKVIVATDAGTTSIWPNLKSAQIPVQIYAAATAPLSSELRRRLLANNTICSDTRQDLRAYRLSADNRLVIGGTHTLWVDAKRRGLKTATKKIVETFPFLGEAATAVEYWEGVFSLVIDRLPRLMELAPGLFFTGVYSGRGIALSFSLGEKIGAMLADKSRPADMPIPVTNLRPVPMHGLTTQIVRRSYPILRLQDRIR